MVRIAVHPDGAVGLHDKGLVSNGKRSPVVTEFSPRQLGPTIPDFGLPELLAQRRFLNHFGQYVADAGGFILSQDGLSQFVRMYFRIVRTIPSRQVGSW